MITNRLIGILLLAAVIASAGCASKIPNTFLIVPDNLSAPRGNVLAIADDGINVVVVTRDGFYRRSGDESWERIQALDRETARRVTAVAMSGTELFIGTKNKGLLILTGNSVESINASKGFLPDDHVFSIAVEGEGEGLEGNNVWVGTKSGLSVRKNSSWEVYTPRTRWLTELTKAKLPRRGTVYVTSRARLGQGGDDKRGFTPPVTAAAIGIERVVLGSKNSRIAVIENGAFSTIRLEKNLEITSLLFRPSAIWAGTSKGLFWGGLRGLAKGEPYPGWRGIHPYRSTMFGIRDTRPFDYAWYRVGYNSARVTDLTWDNDGGLWVNFRADLTLDPDPMIDLSPRSSGTEEYAYESRTELRRYTNIEEYIEQRAKPYFELYGKAAEVPGLPTVLSFTTGEGGVWLGTTKGVVNLR
ncbi:MAG: hypothetical protein ACC669_10800 [bacterium]